MGKVKELLSLIKVSKRAQIIASAVAVTTTVGVVGGIAVYNHNQKAAVKAEIEVQGQNDNELVALRQEFEDIKAKVYKMMNTDKLNIAKDKIKAFEIAYEEEDKEELNRVLKELKDILPELVKENEERIAKELDEVKKISLENKSDKDKKEVENKIKEVEELFKNENYSGAYDKVVLAKEFASNLKDTANEEDKKDEVADSGDGNNSNEGNGDSNSGSNNSDSTNNGGNNNSGGTPTPPPVIEQTPPPAPSIASGWKNDIAQQVVGRLSGTGTNNTDVNSQSCVMTPEHYSFLVATCDSWTNGTIDAGSAKSQMADNKFEFLGTGEISLSQSVVASFQVQGLDVDSIVSQVLGGYWSASNFVYCKVYYDTNTDISTVYIANGLIW